MKVTDRPFSLSEWMALIPNQWVAEGVPIIALYGMGLQGWDASFHFASDFPRFTETIHTPGGYNVDRDPWSFEMKKNPDHQDNLVALRRIEGQVRGVQGMIEKRKYCVDILTQLQAIKGALSRVEEKILDKHRIYTACAGPGVFSYINGR